MPVCLIAQPIHAAGVEQLRAAGVEVRHASAVDPATLAREIADADAVIIRDGLPASVIDAAPRLAIIANHGTGTDKVDVKHAQAIGVPVTYTPDANVRAVAEHAVMLMMAVARQVVAADAATRVGNWRFKYGSQMFSLHGKTLGIVGFGRTGRLLCDIAVRGLGMHALVWSPNADPDQIGAHGARRAASLQELLQRADVISLHRPLRADSRHTLDAAAFRQMKPQAIVINTSRGGLIDEAALVAALQEGRIFGAGLDVFEREPLSADSPLATLANVVLTPHMAGSTEEALHATATQCAGQIIDALAGRQPANLVNPDMWAGRRQTAAGPLAPIQA